MMFPSWRLGICAAALLAGCATPPPPAPASPEPTPPAARWWTVFGDTGLDGFIERVDTSAPGVQQAAARLAQARAAARAAGAATQPLVGVSAGAGRQGGPLLNAAGDSGTLLTLGAAVSYEIDLAGRLSDGARAAALDAASRESTLRAARLLAQAEAAQHWLALRAIDGERELVDALVAVRREIVTLESGRVAAGLAPPTVLTQARVEATAAESKRFVLERRRAEATHALRVLAGGPVEAPAASADPLRLPAIPPGIPSSVLARRPDVAAAERSWQAAQLRLGIARSAGWPTLNLTASGGVASAELGDLIKSAARNWGVGLLLSLPVFDGGRRAAGVDAAAADLELAAAEHRERLLVALREVDDQLAALQALAGQSELQARLVQEATGVLEQARSRQGSGLASQREVLEARHAALREQLAERQLAEARRQATVTLVRALGGGWDGPVATAQASIR